MIYADPAATSATIARRVKPMEVVVVHMARLPSVKSVELEGEYYHVRFRDPGEFEEIRTPEWATTAAREVSEGATVRMGHRAESDFWVVQSVLVAKTVGESTARSQAKKILEKIED